jgi:hypothetical protein
MLPTVEIPGYAEALRREQRVRAAAWRQPADTLAGVPVRPLTLAEIGHLEDMRNGFFVPFTFATEAEIDGHCAQLVWWLSACPKPARDAGRGGLRYLYTWQARRELLAYLAAHRDALRREVMDWLADNFMDAPKSDGGLLGQPEAHGNAYIMDALAAAGYGFSEAEVLNMPLPRLWQYVRLASRRLSGRPLTNPSDRVATDYLAAQAAGGRN